MRQRHGRLLRGGWPHDRLLPDVWLVTAGYRLRPSKARTPLRAVLGRKGLDVLRRGRSAPDRAIAALLGGAEVRPRSGSQSARLQDTSADALPDEGGWHRALRWNHHIRRPPS